MTQKATPVADSKRSWWRRRWPWHRIPDRYRRLTRMVVVVAVALAAASFVSLVTIDLGPLVRAKAEKAASDQLARTVRIGRLSTYILPGHFLIEDFVIEGLEPDHAPFLTGEQLVISTSWLALLWGEILVDDVDMHSWRMVVESFPDGRNSFPQFVVKRDADEDTETGEPLAATDQDDNAAAASTGRIVTTVQNLHAHNGELVYRDHNTPWSVIARNIDLTLEKRDIYGGDLSFRNGTVTIRDFEPMTANMNATYDLDDGHVTLTNIALSVDGFRSTVTGEVDLLAWPEQTYRIVESDIALETMKDIFFADDPFTAGGEANLTGTWHIYDGGRNLTGSFVSSSWTLNELVFPDTAASVVWTDDRFEVFDYVSGFYDGTLALRYLMAPLGSDEPGMAVLETAVATADLAQLTGALELTGIRPQGVVTDWNNTLRWPLGEFREHTGEGQITLAPPAGVRGLASVAGRRQVPFDPAGEPWRVPVAGELTYDVGPEWLEISPSHLETPETRIEFEGRTAYGDRSQIPFYMSSTDWQESDRLMAAVITAFGNPTEEIAVKGSGEARGVMLGSFSAPRIEARFEGDDLQAWNVGWGSGAGKIVVENGYLDVTDGVFDQVSSKVDVNGRFAIGFPRPDGGEEINARFVLSTLPAQQLRDAFSLVGYEIDGPMTGEFHLTGMYTRPFGLGELIIEQPVAWGEPFDFATTRLRFEGGGVRLDGLEMRKGEGQLTGAMFVRWNGTYAFNLDGRDFEVGSIESARDKRVLLSGHAEFTATGAGAFANPRYQVRGTIRDFGVRGETVGQITGRADVADGAMHVVIEAASPELAISGSGRIDLKGGHDADLAFRLTNTAIDPFVRTYTTELPAEISAVVSGTLQLAGPLREVEALSMNVTVEELRLELFDYAVRNEGLVRFGLDNNIVNVHEMHLVGAGTALKLTGRIDVGNERVLLRADGDMSLAILQAFFPDIRSSGLAQLEADIGGTVSEPILVGAATVSSGRIRHFSLPHALDEIEGNVVFEPNSIRFNELTGRLASGPLTFGGRVGLGGYKITELDISARATGMRLRFPEGVRSVVDAELTLGGDLEGVVLSGTATVRDAIWLNLFNPSTDFLDFVSDEGGLVPQTVEPTLPLRYDVRVVAPSSLRINDSLARLVASAELTVGGTYDQPLLFGNVELDRGEMFFEGNRYRATRGSISFSNPNRIEPNLDLEVSTDIRVPTQTYRITIGVRGVIGTMDRPEVTLASDPPLQSAQIFSLLLGDIRDPQAAEIRSLRDQELARQELLQAGAARLLTSPLSSEVGRVIEDSFGVDSFQIAPSLSDPTTQQQSTQLLPTARVLVGKRISDRAHITFSRAVSGANQDLVVVLEYDQNERLSWVLSQNADRTYALDFQVRHAF